MIFLFYFIVLSKRGCDKALTNTVRFFGLIKTSASLLSPIAPLGDPWVASTSTLRLKWMFTSPNDYLSQCWVNASALFAAKVTHTHTETRPQTSASVEPLNNPFATCFCSGVLDRCYVAHWHRVALHCFKKIKQGRNLLIFQLNLCRKFKSRRKTYLHCL